MLKFVHEIVYTLKKQIFRKKWEINKERKNDNKLMHNKKVDKKTHPTAEFSKYFH